jgi:hypothetical protein
VQWQRQRQQRGEGRRQLPGAQVRRWVSEREVQVPGENGELETCDDGENTQECNGNDNDNSTAESKGNCQKPRCGDGYVNTEFKPAWPAAGPPEVCDAGMDGMDAPNCNGNGPGNDAAKCQMPRCGDGYVNALFAPPGNGVLPEQCDTGAEGNTNECNGNDNSNGGKCRVPFCGDGYFNSTMEQCDPAAPDPDGPCEGEGSCDLLCMCVV